MVERDVYLVCSNLIDVDSLFGGLKEINHSNTDNNGPIIKINFIEHQTFFENDIQRHGK